MACVGADQLHSSARQCHVEHARVRRVGEVEANDLAALDFERKLGFARREHDVAEATHGDMGGFRRAERGDLTVFDQDVIEGQHDLPVRRRPVLGILWRGEDVSVQAHFLPVILADVRVEPERAGIGNVHLIRECFADRNRCLGVVGSVVTVVQA